MKKDTKMDNEVLQSLIENNLQEDSDSPEQSEVMTVGAEDTEAMAGDAPKRAARPSSDKTGGELIEALGSNTRKLLQLRSGRKRQKPITDDYVRSSFILRGTQVEKLRVMSMREGISLKAIVEEAFRSCIEKYESKYGTLVVTPQERKDVADLFSD